MGSPRNPRGPDEARMIQRIVSAFAIHNAEGGDGQGEP